MKWETPGTFIINLIYVVLFVTFYYWFFWELSTKWGVQ